MMRKANNPPEKIKFTALFPDNLEPLSLQDACRTQETFNIYKVGYVDGWNECIAMMNANYKQFLKQRRRKKR